MLSQSDIFYPSLIASMFDMILSKPKQIQIQAQFISPAVIPNHLESMGILTLEYFIRLHQTNDQHDFINESAKKKFQSDLDLNNKIYKQVDHWRELAECYRSLCDYNDVRGIFVR